MQFTGSERFLLINIYRPPHYIEAAFFDELSDFYDATTNLGGHPVLLGDINCLGNTPDMYDVRLLAWLLCYDLITVTDGPTRMHHDGSLSPLDLIAEPSEQSQLSAPATVLVGFSDHRLLKAVLGCTRPPAPSVTYTYHDLKHIDVPAFCAYL